MTLPPAPILSAVQVRVVRALAECRHTAEAAAALNMSQSTLHRHVHAAEVCLDTPLFQRGWSGTETTAGGDAVVRQCQRIMETLEKLDVALAPSRVAIHARWRHLRSVAAVVQTGSASGAAADLGVQQPAISQALRDVAAYAGQALFQRHRRGLKPTAAGLRLAAVWSKIAEELAQMPRLIDASATGLTGRVAVGMLPFSGQNLVVETFADLTLDHPQIRLIAVPGSYGALCQALLRGEIDLMIGTLREAALPPEFVEQALYHEQFMMIARRDHPCHSSPQTLTTLARQRWSVAPHGTPVRRYFEALFRDMQTPPVTQSCEIFSFSNAEQFLVGSDSIAMLSYSAPRLRVLHPALKRVEIALPHPQIPIGVTRVAADAIPPAVARFVDRLKARIARLDEAV